MPTPSFFYLLQNKSQKEKCLGDEKRKAKLFNRELQCTYAGGIFLSFLKIYEEALWNTLKTAQTGYMATRYETRGTAGSCLLHTLFPGRTSLKLLFAWNITLVRALQPRSPGRLCARWKLLPTTLAVRGMGSRERPRPRQGGMRARVPATDWEGEQSFSARKMGEPAGGEWRNATGNRPGPKRV